MLRKLREASNKETEAKVIPVKESKPKKKEGK